MANKRGGGVGVAVPPLTSRLDATPYADFGSKFMTGQTLLEYTELTLGAGDVAVVKGNFVYYTDANRQKVTNDVSSALNSGVNHCAGVVPYAVAAGNSGKGIFILKQGPSEYPPGTNISVTTDVSFNAGAALVGSAPTDGDAGRVAQGTAPTHQIVGWALAASGAALAAKAHLTII